MAKALIDGVNVHYQVSGSGPDVALVHGLTGDLSSWYINFVPVLSRKYRVLIYDLRGHGLSDMPESGYTSAHLAAELAGLLDHVGMERPFLVGHSYGGVIAMAFAARYPERARGLVFYDTGFAILERLHDWKNWRGWETYKKELAALKIEKYNYRDFYDPFIMLEKAADVVLPFGLRAGKRRKHRRLRKLMYETTAAAEFRSTAELTEGQILAVRTPTLGIYGDGSPLWKAGEYLAASMPNCRMRMVSNVGHFHVLEHPEVFRDHVVRFIDEALAAESGLLGALPAP